MSYIQSPDNTRGNNSHKFLLSMADGKQGDHLFDNLDPDLSPSEISLLQSRRRRGFKIPPGVADETTFIPKQKLPINFENTPVDFIVGHAYAPDDFHVQLLSKVHLLDQLMDEMEMFYCDWSLKGFSVPFIYPGIQGLLVAVVYIEEGTMKSAGWHRGIIIQIEDIERVQVKYLDYGTICVVHLRYLRLLRLDFCQLPAQALPARLMGLKPFGKTKHWSPKAINTFREACWRANNYNTGGVVAVEVKRGKKNKLDLVLIDTSSNTLTDGVNIIAELVRLKLAEHKPLPLSPDSSEHSWTSISEESCEPKEDLYHPKVNVNDLSQELCEYDQRTMDLVLAMSEEKVRPWLEDENNMFDVYEDVCVDMINLCLSDLSCESNQSSSN